MAEPASPTASITQETPVPAAPAPVPAPLIMLDEFCRERSARDPRPELIAGFHADERRGGRLSDTSDAYAQRFVAYCTRPVEG